MKSHKPANPIAKAPAEAASNSQPVKSAEERFRIETNRNIRVYLAQLLYREKEAIVRRIAHQENVDVVNLAMELARLRGTKEPAEYLVEAARLLTDARAALIDEAERPKREADNLTVEMRAKLSALGRVPFAQLFDAGKGKRGDGDDAGTTVFKWENDADEVEEFHWKKFSSERGFRKCLTKHATRINAEGKAQLEKVFAAAPIDFAKARDILERHIPLRIGDHSSIAELKTAGEVRQFWNEKEKDAVSKFADKLFNEARRGELHLPTIRAIWETRHEGNTVRAMKAARGKANQS